MKINIKKSGFVLVNVLVFGVIAMIVTSALVNWGATMIKATRQLTAKEQALQIAEAGIDYYRWHLAHAPNDYKDGTASTSNGPFIHDFEDKDGNVIGKFALTITPPPTGSTLIKIKSKGTVIADENVSRSIQVSLAIPSFAKFAVVANDSMRFGEGTEVFGPIHSNGGIRFDGLAHNVVTSALSTYTDTDSDACTTNSWGVHTCSGTDDPSPNTPVNNRSDIFMAGRQFPVAAIDFLGITTDLSSMKANAISSGKYFAASGVQGYHIVLKTNDTFDIYKVNSLVTPSNNCRNSSSSGAGWGTWSINTQTLFQSNVAFPSNGIIFVEDHLWVDGQIDTARLTLAAGRFPDSSSTWKDITINSDLQYTNFDGQDAIALVAQGNVNVGLNSDTDLILDAALISQNGRIGRYFYSSSCTNYLRNSITLYGMLGTSHRYGFSWISGGTQVSGYTTRNIIYDSNLLYAPPPSFPLTSNQYSILSWEEVP